MDALIPLMVEGIKLLVNFFKEPFVCAVHVVDHYEVYKFKTEEAAKGAWIKAMKHKPHPYASAFIIKGEIQAYFVDSSFDAKFVKGLVMNYAFIKSPGCHVTHE